MNAKCIHVIDPVVLLFWTRVLVLLDVVNKGMAMPEETIPAQRPQQFISGQQQPGGLRSTNYYTNAMQPASFYAQPQQVRNYGSIY